MAITIRNLNIAKKTYKVYQDVFKNFEAYLHQFSDSSEINLDMIRLIKYHWYFDLIIDAHALGHFEALNTGDFEHYFENNLEVREFMAADTQGLMKYYEYETHEVCPICNEELEFKYSEQIISVEVTAYGLMITKNYTCISPNKLIGALYDNGILPLFKVNNWDEDMGYYDTDLRYEYQGDTYGPDCYCQGQGGCEGSDASGITLKLINMNKGDYIIFPDETLDPDEDVEALIEDDFLHFWRSNYDPW